MAMVKWDPWSELRAMQERMQRLLEMSGERAGSEPFEQGFWQPAADIYEDDLEVVVKMEVPEVDQENIDVRIEDHALIVEGTRRLEWEGKTPNYQRIERGYGKFRRVFALPVAIDDDRVSARCERGVLKIVLPKKVPGAPRQIEISAG
jgi:HSP20 family protein